MQVSSLGEKRGKRKMEEGRVEVAVWEHCHGRRKEGRLTGGRGGVGKTREAEKNLGAQVMQIIGEF